MTVSGVSLLTGLGSVASDASGPAGVADGADAFASMLADMAQPQNSLPSAPSGDDAKGDPRTRSVDEDVATEQDKDSAGTKAQGERDAALMAMLGVPVPPVVTGHSAPADTGDAKKGASSAPAMSISSRRPRGQDPIPIIPQPGRGDSDQDGATRGPVPIIPEPGRHPGIHPRGSAQQGAQPDASPSAVEDGSGIISPTDAPPAGTGGTGDTHAALQPAAQQVGQGALPTVASAARQAVPVVLGPLPATAALMVARAATGKPAPTADQAATPRKAHEEDRSEDSPAPDHSLSSATTAPTAAHAPASGKTSAPSSMPLDNAGQILASGTADRHLDLARQGAWLDGLAHDIASAGGSSGTVRFQVSPEHLGNVQIEVKRGDDGSAVTLTATNEASRVALADAQPQLIAEARAHGLHITSTQVDVGHGDGGSNRDSQPQSNGSHNDPRGHNLSQSGGFSSQAGGGGSTGQRSQTRSQLLTEYQDRTGRTDRGSESVAPASRSAAAATDARYA